MSETPTLSPGAGEEHPETAATRDAAAATEPPATPAVGSTELVVKDDNDRGAAVSKALSMPLNLSQLGVDLSGLKQRFRFRRPRLRLVPAIIFVAVLMLGVRVGDLWDHMILVLDRPLEPPSIAFAPDPDGEQDTATAIASLVATAAAQDEVAAAEPEPIHQPMEPPVAEGETEMPTDPEPDAVSALTDVDPRDMSPVELEMLRGLAQRRAELEAREGELDQREALLEVAERRMSETMGELEALRAEIEGMLGQADARREQQLVSLVRMYEAMRPADAAAIFDGLELEVLLNVLERMREAKAAPIVAGMTPERAREVTSELALRQAPEMPETE